MNIFDIKFPESSALTLCELLHLVCIGDQYNLCFVDNDDDTHSIMVWGGVPV
jgi:hypothetical protein